MVPNIPIFMKCNLYKVPFVSVYNIFFTKMFLIAYDFMEDDLFFCGWPLAKPNSIQL